MTYVSYQVISTFFLRLQVCFAYSGIRMFAASLSAPVALLFLDPQVPIGRLGSETLTVVRP